MSPSSVYPETTVPADRGGTPSVRRDGDRHPAPTATGATGGKLYAEVTFTAVYTEPAAHEITLTLAIGIPRSLMSLAHPAVAYEPEPVTAWLDTSELREQLWDQFAGENQREGWDGVLDDFDYFPDPVRTQTAITAVYWEQDEA